MLQLLLVVVVIVVKPQYLFSVINNIFVLDGQAIAIKRGNQVDRVVASINRHLAILNGLAETSTSFDDVKNPLGEIYNSVKTSGNEKGTPTCIMKKAINLLSFKDRCKEELILLKDKMSALSSFFLNQIQVIESFVHKEASSEEQKGFRSMALTKQIHYHNELQMLKKMWSGILELCCKLQYRNIFPSGKM